MLGRFVKAVTEAINSLKELYEQVIVGANAFMKLTENQRIYAESLITDILKQGLHQKLTAYT
jgi:hypothetical protein